jgi:DNA-binding transcriptional ArsR family regulator
VSKAVTDIDDPRLVKALAHPVRIKILGILEHRTATPKEVARELGIPVENVSYHFRTLKQYGFIRLERKRQVRGAVEHHYRSVARPRITEDAWERLPDIVKRAMTDANLGQLNEVVERAADQGKFDRPDSHIQRMPHTLDDEAFAQASKVMTEALEKIAKLEDEAQRRIRRGKSDPLPAVAIVMLFERPDPPPLPADAQAAPRGGRARAKKPARASG